MMRERLRSVVLLGLGVGVLGVSLSMVPGVLKVEESLGLGWLFSIRGPVPPPSDVVVVSIASDSADALGLTSHLDRWPRGLHARVIDRLAEAGAAAVAFDIMFDRPRDPDDDRRLEEALAAAGNGILLEEVKSDSVDLGHGGRAVWEQHVPPIDRLKRAALATAPFPLPVVPIRVNQFWTFGRAVGDTPTLPVVALQAFALPVLDEFVDLLQTVRPGLSLRLHLASGAVAKAGHDPALGKSAGLESTMRRLREVFRLDPRLGADALRELEARAPPPERGRLLKALIGVYAGGDSRYFSYYGPARTISTVPYYRLLHGMSAAEAGRLFGGKTVFVGFSESRQPEQQDWFFSVFSEQSGQNLSGVEIGATAFANLLDGRFVRPFTLPLHWLVVFGWGFAIAALAAALPATAATLAALAAAAVYVAATGVGFVRFGLWSPLVVPVMAQLPVALFSALFLSHRAVRRQRERIQAALGYYLPKRAVDRLAHETAGNPANKELVFGTCLVTDAEQYTTLSESLAPDELGALMDEYYAVLLEVVARHGGLVSDLAGDSMVAVWAGARGADGTAAEACAAATELESAVERFNSTRGHRGLPTRVGVDSGQLLLGTIGSKLRGEYRAVGDIVNTAARLQGLSRHLGTRTLISGATAAHLTGFTTRSLGQFLLVGKRVPVSVFELRDASRPNGDLEGAFADALAAFRRGRWHEAARAFDAVLQRFGEDGPSRYYLDLCRRFELDPPESWGGIVRMTVK